MKMNLLSLIVVLLVAAVMATPAIDSLTVLPASLDTAQTAYCQFLGHETATDLSLVNLTATVCWLNGATVVGTCGTAAITNGTASNISTLAAASITADANLSCNATLTSYGVKTTESAYNDTLLNGGTGVSNASLTLAPYSTGTITIASKGPAGETVTAWLNGNLLGAIASSGSAKNDTWLGVTLAQGVNSFLFINSNLSSVAALNYNDTVLAGAGTRNITPTYAPLASVANITIVSTVSSAYSISKASNTSGLVGNGTLTITLTHPSVNLNLSIGTNVSNMTGMNYSVSFNGVWLGNITANSTYNGLVTGVLGINNVTITSDNSSVNLTNASISSAYYSNYTVFLNGARLGQMSSTTSTWNGQTVLAGVNNVTITTNDASLNMTNATMAYLRAIGYTNITNSTLLSNSFAASATTAVTTAARVYPLVGKCDNLTAWAGYTVGRNFSGTSAICLLFTKNNSVLDGAGYTITANLTAVSLRGNNETVKNLNVISTSGIGTRLNGSNATVLLNDTFVCAGDCVQLINTAMWTTITNSTINSSAGWGINITSGSNNTTTSGNTIYGARPFVDSGAGNVIPTDQWQLPVAIGAVLALIIATVAVTRTGKKPSS